MKTYFNSLLNSNSFLRALFLLLRGYVFGSNFGRFEFRRSFFRARFYSLGVVGVWVVTVILCALPFVALWLVLWLGYDAGMTM